MFNFKLTPIKALHQRRALKSKICEVCGCEIPKGDLYFQYKPYRGKWRNRCIDHKPLYYEESETYNENWLILSGKY